jgi:hypothetical protein
MTIIIDEWGDLKCLTGGTDVGLLSDTGSSEMM